MSTMNIGEEGFWWFFGVVESIDDPKKMGRVQVRVHNIHSEKKTELPTTELPWAVPMLPITSAGTKWVGASPTGIMVGSNVFGFFVDGRAAQHPVLIGTMPGIPDNNEALHDVAPEARELNRVNKQPVAPEPASAYRAKYPHNKVTRTTSGHVIEIDDTPGAERIQVYHKSGTYVEIDQTGRTVLKSAGDQFNISVKNNTMYVGGNLNIEVKGNAVITAPKTTINGALEVKGPFSAASGGSVSGSLTVTGSVTSPVFHGLADRAKALG